MATGNMSLPPNLTQQHIQEVFQVRRLVNFFALGAYPLLIVLFFSFLTLTNYLWQCLLQLISLTVA